jgi:hypothetical protein
MATQPGIRIGDRERDAVAAELREHFAHGRLTKDEFNQRLDAVFAAKTQAQLTHITADLPHARPSGPPLPSSRTGARPNMMATAPAAGHWTGIDWPGTDWTGGRNSGYSWGGYRQRGRRHLAALSSLVAALLSLLIVFDFMAAVRFPLPGRLGLVVAVFTIIRGLLRRVLRGTRGRRFR